MLSVRSRSACVDRCTQRQRRFVPWTHHFRAAAVCALQTYTWSQRAIFPTARTRAVVREHVQSPAAGAAVNRYCGTRLMFDERPHSAGQRSFSVCSIESGLAVQAALGEGKCLGGGSIVDAGNASRWSLDGAIPKPALGVSAGMHRSERVRPSTSRSCCLWQTARDDGPISKRPRFGSPLRTPAQLHPSRPAPLARHSHTAIAGILSH